MNKLPSAEQRAATAHKYGKPVPFPIDQVRPPGVKALVDAEMDPRRRKHSWAWYLNMGCLGLFAVGFVEIFIWHWTGHTSETTHGLCPYLGGAGAMYAAGLLFIGFWLIFGFIAFFVIWFKMGNDAINEAKRSIPSPAEIELELRRRGYSPSIADVMAVHQAAKREQMENVALAGLWFATTAVLAKSMGDAGRGANLG